MRFERISTNKIKVTLTKKDLKEWDIDLEDPEFPSARMQDLFVFVMHRAEDELGIRLDNCRLMIEPCAEFHELLEFVITKYEEDARPVRVRAKQTPRLFELLYRFDTFEALLHSVHAVSDLPFRKSSLFLYQDSYYLLISKARIKSEYVTMLRWRFMEYGNEIEVSDWQKGVLLEHGECIIEKDALNTIKKYFTQI